MERTKSQTNTTSMNYTEDLTKIMNVGNYRGVLVERMIGGGWRLLGQNAATPKEVDEIINKAIQSINDSIK